jgi:hypothetical protein
VQSINTNTLMNLLGGAPQQPVQQQNTASGGLLSSLFNLLGG